MSTPREQWQAAFEGSKLRDAPFTTMSGIPLEPVYGPDDGELRIAVKKVDGGAFSTWAADELKAGDDPFDERQARFSIEAARRDLGYAPKVGLQQGILNYSTWLASQRNDRS